MSEINVQLGQGPATQMPAPVTVGEALKMGRPVAVVRVLSRRRSIRDLRVRNQDRKMGFTRNPRLGLGECDASTSTNPRNRQGFRAFLGSRQKITLRSRLIQV